MVGARQKENDGNPTPENLTLYLAITLSFLHCQQVSVPLYLIVYYI